MMSMDAAKIEAETAKVLAASIKLNDETFKLQAEIAKLARAARWYPAIVSVAFIGALVAVVKFFAP
jgi:hypothetical protein